MLARAVLVLLVSLGCLAGCSSPPERPALAGIDEAAVSFAGEWPLDDPRADLARCWEAEARRRGPGPRLAPAGAPREGRRATVTITARSVEHDWRTRTRSGQGVALPGEPVDDHHEAELAFTIEAVDAATGERILSLSDVLSSATVVPHEPDPAATRRRVLEDVARAALAECARRLLGAMPIEGER